MNWKKEVFENFKLYAVTDLQPGMDERAVLPQCEAAWRGGADIVQLRAKGIPDGILLRLALKLRTTADKCRKLFFVNDRPDLALASGADGVHVGQEDMPVAAVRALARQSGRQWWIGKSTHSLEQALTAQEEGPDYVGVGPVYQTPTKPGYQPAGLEFVSLAARHLKLPFVAIGGIGLSNAEEVLSAGARRLAVVRAVFSSKDPYEAARELRNKIENFVHA